MSVLYVRARDNVTPDNFVVDFNDVVDTPGPYMIGVAAWVSTADAAAGAQDFVIDYEDPTANVRQAVFGATMRIFLNDPTSQFATDMVLLQRLSGSSLWTFTGILSGSAGSALISYRIMHSSASAPDLQPW